MEHLLSDAIKNYEISHKIDSVYSEDVKQKKLTQKQQVYFTIGRLGKASDRDIAKATGLSLTIIPDRRGLLLKQDIIEIAGETEDKQTKKKVTLYKIKE
ncbi:MAG: hypothetical protein Q8933_20070 [Bacteroidota bacterium]|nr:hypothetical protein [Bacteroidota bacterium]